LFGSRFVGGPGHGGVLQSTGAWKAEVIKDTWLPVPPGATRPPPGYRPANMVRSRSRAETSGKQRPKPAPDLNLRPLGSANTTGLCSGTKRSVDRARPTRPPLHRATVGEPPRECFREGILMRQTRYQPPSSPHKRALCAVNRPTQSPTTKHTRPNIRARSEPRAHSRITAVVMAARRLVDGSVRQEVSHNFIQMQANGFGKSGLAFVDKKRRAPPKRGRR
jgi:hypothetical protein